MEIILYLELDLVCIAILFSVYIRDTTQRNNDTYHILFTRALFSNILFFVSDILWGLMSLTPHPHIWQNWIVNILYFSMSGIASYFWLDFVERIIKPKLVKTRIGVFVRMIPMMLLILLSVASVETNWLFYIDSAGHYQRGSLYLIQPILAYILPVYASVISLRAMLKSQNSEKRRQYRSLALFFVMPALGGIGQIVVEGTPLLNIGIALSGLWIYFTFQDNIIMLDPLTSMHNRRSFDRTLESMIRGFDEKSGIRLWMIIMDVDYFKKINDGFGHAEGDRALITISRVLKEVQAGFECMTARIGGDEFAVCCKGNDDNLPEQICEAVRRELNKKSAGYPFRITLSMGCAEYQAGHTAQQLFIAADKKLYEIKKAR